MQWMRRLLGPFKRLLTFFIYPPLKIKARMLTVKTLLWTSLPPRVKFEVALCFFPSGLARIWHLKAIWTNPSRLSHLSRRFVPEAKTGYSYIHNALCICTFTFPIRPFISLEILSLDSLDNVSMLSLTTFPLSTLGSCKFPNSFVQDEPPCVFLSLDSWSLLVSMNLSETSLNSLSLLFASEFPITMSILSLSDTMFNSLDLLDLAFCLLVGGILQKNGFQYFIEFNFISLNTLNDKIKAACLQINGSN